MQPHLHLKDLIENSTLKQLALNIFTMIKEFDLPQREELFDMIPLRPIEMKNDMGIPLPVLEGASSSIQVSNLHFT